jgi:maleylpyruvate isomerase
VSADSLLLHSYYRSSAAWRVRIALNLKGLGHRIATRHLRRGEQSAPDYLALNPQGLVPTLEIAGEGALTQSLAIIDYLDQVRPEPPLRPGSALRRARILAFALVIACDIHPVQNLKVLQRLRALGHTEPEVAGWAKTVIEEGLEACERLIADEPGPFCFGPTPTLADLCLVPQLANARRFGGALHWPRLEAAERAALALPAFAAAAPERQPDFEAAST